MPNNNKKPFQPKIDPSYVPNASKEVLDKPITALNIYPETQAKLEAVGIKTVFDVAILEMKYLYRIDNMSKKDVFAVMRGLHSLKLDFKKSEKPTIPNGVEQPTLPKQDKPKCAPDNRNNNRNADVRPDVRPIDNRGDNRTMDNRNNNVDRTQQREQRQPNVAHQRERMNTREDFNDNGTIKQEREHNRDFDRNDKRRNTDNRNNNSNTNNNTNINANINAKQQPIKKPPIVLPPLIIEDGLYKFFKAGKWGYKTDKGEVVIEPQFDEAYNFSEGMAGIELHERVGFINKVGEIVIDAKFDTVCSFVEGLASVTIDNVSWYIDKEGNKQFDMEFESATPFKNGSALVKKEGKWNFITRETGELRPR